MAEDNELADFDPAEEEDETRKEETRGDNAGVSMTSFRDFLLRPELNRAIQDCGFESPSPVQHKTIPAAILGQDILCQAKSGLGKTAVFVLAVLQQLDDQADSKAVQCLVLCHTRELAYQIAKEFGPERFSKYMPKAKCAVFFGGTLMSKDVEVLNTKSDEFPSIVVGTPGRVKALVTQDKLVLSKLKFFVLDECDKVLSQLDMRRDVQDIFYKTNKQKQVMMFSATMPADMRETAKLFMQNPVEIYVDSEKKLTLHGLQQYKVDVTESAKNRKLNEILDSLEFNQVSVFVKSVNRAKVLADLLRDCGFPAICIHSSMPQDARIAAYSDFKAFKSRIMVSTDLMGRGIDIERVNIVINYDMAPDEDSYLHRVGRAGRFNTKGLAITFLSSEEDTAIMKKVGERFEVTVKDLPAKVEVSTYMPS